MILEWTSETPGPPPATLYQAFQNDAYAEGYVGKGEFVLTGPSGILKIEVNLAWGANCGSTSLWLHVPETENLYEASNVFLANYREVLSRLDMQRKLPAQSGCTIAPKTSSEARFSGKIYIYNNKEIHSDHHMELNRIYAKDGVSIEFRGAAYLAKQIANWPTTKDRVPHSVVMMMVGDDAPSAPRGPARRSAAANMARVW